MDSPPLHSSMSELVQSLCAHFTSSASSSDAAAAATPSQLFDVAAITAGYLVGRPAEEHIGGKASPLSAACRMQLDNLAREYEGMAAAPGAAVSSPCAVVCSLAALTLVTLSGLSARGDGATSSHPANTPEEEEEEEREAVRFVLAIASRFEGCTRRVLTNGSLSLSEDTLSAVCYCAARLMVCGSRWHLSHELLKEACEVVAHKDGQRGGGPASSLPAAVAVELIAQCASLIVACRPPTLREASVDPTVLVGKTKGITERAATDAGEGGKDKDAVRRAGPVTEKATADASSASSVSPARPHLLPLPTAAGVTSLQAALIDCCIGGLDSGNGAGVAGSTEDNASLLCRRVLIPLLLMDRGGEEAASGIAVYERRLHALLRSLSGMTIDGDTAAAPGGGLEDCKRRSEAVVIVAALFDYLFRPKPLKGGDGEHREGEECDYRYSPLLWALLMQSFRDSMTCTELDAGRRASMQLRSEYLLKRIVSLCEEQQREEAVAAPTTTSFNECFSWTTAACATRPPMKGKGKQAVRDGKSGSAASWELFFLALEAFNEFGVHMTVPAFAKLDALVGKLQEQLEGDGSHRDNGALHVRWVELLFLKLVQHPNLGVRKLGLRRLWSLPQSVLGGFTDEFLYGYAFRSAADPRLCSDLDRMPVTEAFLASKAPNGGVPAELAEDRVSRDVEPLLQCIRRFYGSLFSLHLRSASARVSAMLLLFEAVSTKPAKFTTAVFVGLFCHLAKTLFHEATAGGDGVLHSSPEAQGAAAAWTVGMALHPEVLQRLTVLMRETLQGNMDLCLDARIVALVFEGLLHFAALAPKRFRACEAFWGVLCLCGPLGQSCGARLDACGTYGAVGASVAPQLLNQRLVALSRELMPSPDGDAAWLVHGLLQPETLAARTENLLSLLLRDDDGSCADGVPVFEETRAKKHFFLLGALLMTESAADASVVASVVHRVSQAVVSLCSRVYASDDTLLTALASLVEVFHSTAGGPLFPMSLLEEMASTVFSRARIALEAGAVAAAGEDHHLGSSAWYLLHTSRWDVIAAAATTLLQLATLQDRAHGAAALQAQEQVEWLVDALGRYADAFAEIGERGGECTSGPRVYASIVVARDASRLLQSVLCGLVYCPAVTLPKREGGLRMGEGLLQEEEGGHVGCFLYTMTPAAAAGAIERLTKALPQRMTAAAANTSSLSTQSSSSFTLAEHFRFVYNAIFLLCQRVLEVGEGSEAVRAHTCRVLEVFGMAQVEECCSNNLAYVYDLLTWVVVAATDEDAAVDREGILSALLGHMEEASAKQYVRVSSLAYNALQHAFPYAPDFVVQKLTEALDDEAGPDRTTYYVALTASLLVLQDPLPRWSVLKEVLLRVSFLYNSNRDGEENESAIAATESVVSLWPDALRLLYVPTVRMAAVGRALALSTILRCCSLDYEATGGEALVQPLCLELLRKNRFDDVVAHEPCMPNSRTHRVRVRLWQLVVLLLPFLPRALSSVAPVFDGLLQHCIPVVNMGSVRRFIEVFAIRLMQRQPSLYKALADALRDGGLRPQVCGTLILVACHALLHDEHVHSACVDDQGDGDTLLGRLLPLVLQQATSNQYLLRVISHIGLYRLCNARLSHGKSISSDTRAIYEYVSHAPEHVKLREKHEASLFYDVAEASSPHSVLCVVREEANTVLRESIPAAAFERMRFVETETCCLIGSFYPIERLRAHLMGVTVQRLRGGRDCQGGRVHTDGGETLVLRTATQTLAVFADAPYLPHTPRRAEYSLDYTAEAVQLLTRDPQTATATTATAAMTADSHVDDDIQRKAVPWWGSEVYNELHPHALPSPSPGRGSRSRRQSIVVVGSLLLNPVNIAGLCRCGDIFAVEQLVIPERKVFDHPHFVATARSAELWIPWAQVAPRDLPAYLMERRQAGYTICGVEQTASSASMASFAFPEKVVVVLGSEGQGIPAPLIPMMDVCVEIPQFGLIRSLNVHVTGAIVMYEYTKQHLMCTGANER